MTCILQIRSQNREKEVLLWRITFSVAQAIQVRNSCESLPKPPQKPYLQINKTAGVVAMILEIITDIYSFINSKCSTTRQAPCWMLGMPGKAENIPLFTSTANIYGVPVARHTMQVSATISLLSWSLWLDKCEFANHTAKCTLRDSDHSVRQKQTISKQRRGTAMGTSKKKDGRWLGENER